MSSLTRPEEIRQQMAEVRSELQHDVATVVQQAKDITDWRNCVKTHPWATVGVAMAVGYIVVPQRLRVESPDYKTLEKLAKNNRLVVESNPKKLAKAGLAGSLFSFLASLAFRSAMPVATSYFSQLFHHDDAKTETQAALMRRPPR